ncbi:YezD family protein [Neobacillus niacini]|uniref:YezD family protein n=1 Tax=Neobacillus niacini TaxID=86668 RepID=UPI0009EF000E|nr:YezD family protein [Neobacillus niacini]MEC1520487.1 YezD family protein [Neobacillus niacini]
MSSKARLDQQVMEKIASLLEGLEFGTVQITVHDSQITQIDRLEKHRLPLKSKQTNVVSNQSKSR